METAFSWQTDWIPVPLFTGLAGMMIQDGAAQETTLLWVAKQSRSTHLLLAMQTDPVTTEKPSSPLWIDVYKENGLTYRYFLDWRHRVMERFGLCAGTVAAVSSYLLAAKDTQADPWPVIGFLLLILAATSYACLFMDRKNALMLLRCENAGRDIETKLVGADEGSKLFYTNQLSDNGSNDPAPKTTPPYNVILPCVYRLSGIVALLGSLGILVGWLIQTYPCH